MPKAKLSAGAEIETISKSEMHEALHAANKSWFQEIARGDTYRRVSSDDTIAAGAITIGGADQRELIGPKEGFVWSVKRITYKLSVGTERLGLYINDQSNRNAVNEALPFYYGFGSDELVLYGGESLLLTNTTALTSVGQVVVSMQVRELPQQLAWRLGG